MSIDLADAPPAPAGGASPTPAGRSRAASAGRGVRVKQPFGRISGPTLGVLVIWLSLIVLLPLTAVVGKAFGSGGSAFWSAISNREVRDALYLTVGLAVGVAVVNAVMGLLIAWVLVRERFRGSALLEFVIDIPFALPTIVAGLVMLALYGANSPIGVTLVGARTGMFVALLFVTLPFTVRTVQPVLLDLDRDAEQAAASLGAAPTAVFRRIVMPQLLPAMASGSALAFARALGEYGSLVYISSALPFKTEWAAQVIYGKLQDPTNVDRSTQQAAAIAAVLLLASALVLTLLYLVERRVARRG
jgi:sulfate transport system permease protein